MPLAATNYLHQLDKVTLDISAAVQAALPGAMPGDRVPVPGSRAPVLLARKPTVPELSRIRRQFLKLATTHPGDDAARVGDQFVSFLNQSLG